ncbi:MAG: hypothetical protein EA416_14715 [Trueperaceae bacterium]|nr:MAG: hypothetical protein EA416_14715 [Trueperaceae bacterium]
MLPRCIAAALLALTAALSMGGAQGVSDDAAFDVVFELESATMVAGWRVESWVPADWDRAFETVVRVVGSDARVAFELRDAVVVAFEQEAGPGWRADLVAVAPGDDLTGDGVPNLLVEAYTGGAHCCFHYALLSLGDTLEVLWEGFLADAGAVVTDLAGDGRRQLMTADMGFAYAFCSFAETPAPAVVLAIEPDGVRVANLDFAEVYEREIVFGLERVLQLPADAGPDSQACALAQLYLSLLYGGRTDVAEAALERLFQGDDLQGFRDALWEIIDGSPWFVAR